MPGAFSKGPSRRSLGEKPPVHSSSVKRWRTRISLAIILAGLVWVGYAGLSRSLAYYLTPSELVAEGRSAVGERVRLGGFVAPGSLVEQKGTIRFIVSDGETQVRAITSSSVPQLFGEARGVILEGEILRNGVFRADTILVKHDGVYSPPAGPETP